MSSSLTLEQISARIENSDFNRLLGVRAESYDGTELVLHCAMRPELRGSPSTGAIHGGVLATLVDTSTCMAVIARTGESVATVDLRVDYHRAGLSDGFRVRSRIVRLGRTLATVDCRVLDEAGELVASGRAVLMNVSAKSPGVGSPR